MPAIDPSTAWFHCGRCGSLFRDVPGANDRRRCTECGLEPSHDHWEAGPAGTVLPPLKDKRELAPVPDIPRVRRKRKNNTIAVVMVLWLGFMSFLIFVAQQFWQEPVAIEDGHARDKQDIGRSMQDQKLLEDHIASVFRTFGAYAVAASNEQRSQFVANPILVAPRMVRYFELNPLIRIDPESLEPHSRDVLYLPEGNEAIEVLWKSDDRLYETLFVRQDDEWRLDWEHFVRYSEHPFSLFLAGDGPQEAEFRLLVRERLANERKHEPEMSLVFYAPVAGRPRETGLQSPEILLPRHQPLGRRLTAAFDLLAKGGRPLGSRLTLEDSDDLVRVRVKLRRIERDEQRSFQIIDLPACHWYGVTASPGVDENDGNAEEP